jgi:hypothetical protein
MVCAGKSRFLVVVSDRCETTTPIKALGLRHVGRVMEFASTRVSIDVRGETM